MSRYIDLASLDVSVQRAIATAEELNNLDGLCVVEKIVQETLADELASASAVAERLKKLEGMASAIKRVRDIGPGEEFGT